MADDDKTDAEAGASTRRAQRDRSAASAVGEAPAQRPEPGGRVLTRTELETLRSRLQKKFH
jgi:hypothetical protein